jgi:hypothetical protein
VTATEKGSSPQPRKKRKMHTSIKDYISCRRWKEEENAKQPQTKHQPEREPVNEEGPPVQGGEQDDQHHHNHPGAGLTGEEEISCSTSRHNRMPAPIVQANTGGIGPIVKPGKIETNMTELHVLREQEVHLEEERQGDHHHHSLEREQHQQHQKEGAQPGGEEIREQEDSHHTDGQGGEQGERLVGGQDGREEQQQDGGDAPAQEERQGEQEDEATKTYKEFLIYCEERRIAWNDQEEESRARMRIQASKQEHWALLRQARSFLKENDEGWKERRKGGKGK